MSCMICHTQHGSRNGLHECVECGREFCIDCGSHEQDTCCECLREEETSRNMDFDICDQTADDILEAVCDGL